jgi:hypothetical protein
MTSLQKKCRNLLAVVILPVFFWASAFAGGPLAVGGPANGTPGQAFVWNPSAMPIQYRVDVGPMATSPSGQVIINNAAGLQRVQAMFNNWQQTPHANISYQYAGPITNPTGGQALDIATLSDYNNALSWCQSGTENPIIFDANGAIIAALGLPPDIIGFASPCKLDAQTGYIDSAFAVLNGQFQDGVSAYPNYELSPTQFDEAITHELGHFSGLAHSQINDSILNAGYPCPLDQLAGLPLMFPFLACQSRKDAGLPILSPDDQAWLAKLYPAADFNSSYGTIKGYILFSDGRSHLQGGNVIARSTTQPLQVAVSSVSGFRFTGNPGQSVTGDNAGGSSHGSRDATLIGYYEIPVPPGTYTVEVESIDTTFQGGSGLPPLDPPVPLPGAHEYWHSDQSAFDDPTVSEPITVNAGQSVDQINIILNSTPPRFDQFEDPGAWLSLPEMLRDRHERKSGEPA